MGEEKQKYVLEMRNIVKVFPGVRALDGMNLQVRAGTVHVIAGENGAGKSTLMKVINGDYPAEEGEVIYKGQVLGKRTIQETIQLGISMIHQELNPITQMTVAENIYIGREPQRVKGFVDDKLMYQKTQELLNRLHMPFKASDKMAKLSIAGHQQVEIAKAISRNASVIIMDEPTSAIADSEVEVLFQQISELKKEGVAIIYITHKMDEIFRIADDITIIRDGKWISSGPAAEYDVDKVISLMVGRKIDNIFPKIEVPVGDVVLEVKNLKQYGRFRDINFKVRKGEILGFSGLVGAGRSEVMRAVFGLDPYHEGEILLNGKKVVIRNTKDAIDYGIAMASEDRRAEGIIPIRSTRENITLANIRSFAKHFLINGKKEKSEVDRMIGMLNIKVTSQEQPIKNLSGGNQQKVILAKWLMGDLNVLILDEPTRGIDVGSKSEIHSLMCEFAKKGLAIIMISSEMPELLGMSDRIVVMREGIITGELLKSEASQEAIMKLAT